MLTSASVPVGLSAPNYFCLHIQNILLVRFASFNPPVLVGLHFICLHCTLYSTVLLLRSVCIYFFLLFWSVCTRSVWTLYILYHPSHCLHLFLDLVLVSLHFICLHINFGWGEIKLFNSIIFYIIPVPGLHFFLPLLLVCLHRSVCSCISFLQGLSTPVSLPCLLLSAFVPISS